MQRTDRWRQLLLALILPAALLLPAQAKAAEGYWLDQYNALLFMGLLRLDPELREMRQTGAQVVMVQADSLPEVFLRWIAWRARRAGLKPVAWIQRPTAGNLKRVGALAGYEALQVDDHFFAAPPVALTTLKRTLSAKELWCSFQPGQYSWSVAWPCDHVDLQVYRLGCRETADVAYRLGLAGRRDTAVAVYHDGSQDDDRRLNCLARQFSQIGNRLFVFKWKNPEHWLTPLTRIFWQGLSHLR